MKSRRVRLFALTLSSLLLISTTPALAKTPKPTLAQIEAAKKAEAEKKKLVDAATAKLNKANLTLRQLAAVANAARIKYEAAKRELAVATQEAAAAGHSGQDFGWRGGETVGPRRRPAAAGRGAVYFYFLKGLVWVWGCWVDGRLCGCRSKWVG